MGDVKRYDPNYAAMSPADDLAVEAEDGMFVMATDYATLEAENAKLRAELERRAVPESWRRMDASFVIEHIRQTSVFDADLIEQMLEYAINAAAPSAPKADDPMKAWADMLYVTHRPLIRNAISLLRLRRPVPPDVESVASGLEEMIAGMPTPAAEPRSAWMEVAALTEPAHEPVNKRLLDGLEDVLWCIDTGPSCQIGVVDRCKCSVCVTGRIRAAIAAARKGEGE